MKTEGKKRRSCTGRNSTLWEDETAFHKKRVMGTFDLPTFGNRQLHLKEGVKGRKMAKLSTNQNEKKEKIKKDRHEGEENQSFSIQRVLLRGGEPGKENSVLVEKIEKKEREDQGCSAQGISGRLRGGPAKKKPPTHRKANNQGKKKFRKKKRRRAGGG